MLHRHRWLAVPLSLLFIDGACQPTRREAGTPVASAVRLAECGANGPSTEARWSPTSATGDVEGVVIGVGGAWGATPRPLADARVIVYEARRSVVTDSAGVFRFGGLPPRRYVVRVASLGFTSWSDTLDLQPGSGLRGKIQLGSNLTVPCCPKTGVCM